MSTAKIALALSKAQAKIMGAVKDSTNPHFNSKFATLESIMDAIREPFSENELAVVQPTVVIEGKLFIKTLLLHSSGETLEGLYPVVCKDWNNPQAVGSGMSYSRRYSLASMACIPQVDDDATAATESKSKEAAYKPKSAARHPEDPPHFERDEPLSPSGVGGEYVISLGKFKGKKIKDIDQGQLQNYSLWLQSESKKANKPIQGTALDFIKNFELFLTP